MNRHAFIFFLVVPVLFLAHGHAHATGDPANGHRIAERWCAQCHAVEREPDRAPTDAVPTFRSVAARVAFDRMRLRAFLASPHAPMPDLSLTRAAIEDLGAYLDQLRER